MIYVVVTLACLLRAEALFENRVLGPADLRFQYLEPCDEGANDTLKITLSQRKYNRTVYIWAVTMETPYMIDDNVTVDLHLAVKKQGGYKQGAFYMNKPLCEALQTTTGDMYKHFLNRAVGIEKCPIPPGSYSMTDFYFDNANFKIPHLYGEYEMTAYIYKEEERISCLRCYYVMERKET